LGAWANFASACSIVLRSAGDNFCFILPVIRSMSMPTKGISLLLCAIAAAIAAGLPPCANGASGEVLVAAKGFCRSPKVYSNTTIAIQAKANIRGARFIDKSIIGVQRYKKNVIALAFAKK
jgi:hypothetical protein